MSKYIARKMGQRVVHILCTRKPQFFIPRTMWSLVPHGPNTWVLPEDKNKWVEKYISSIWWMEVLFLRFNSATFLPLGILCSFPAMLVWPMLGTNPGWLHRSKHFNSRISWAAYLFLILFCLWKGPIWWCSRLTPECIANLCGSGD